MFLWLLQTHPPHDSSPRSSPTSVHAYSRLSSKWAVLLSLDWQIAWAPLRGGRCHFSSRGQLSVCTSSEYWSGRKLCCTLHPVEIGAASNPYERFDTTQTSVGCIVFLAPCVGMPRSQGVLISTTKLKFVGFLGAISRKFLRLAVTVAPGSLFPSSANFYCQKRRLHYIAAA